MQIIIMVIELFSMGFTHNVDYLCIIPMNSKYNFKSFHTLMDVNKIFAIRDLTGIEFHS